MPRMKLAKARRTGVRRRVLLWAFRLIAVGVVVSVGIVAALRVIDPPATAFMVQRYLAAQRSGRADFRMRQRWVPLSALPDHVGLAVIAAEDQRFWSHGGFDLVELRSALAARLGGGRLRGASTLTQQLAKNLFLWEGRSLLRKALEAYLTTLIEFTWPKRRILEVYLNVAELGDGVFGVGAAARHHFGCDARALTAPQAALLAAILPAPQTRLPNRPSGRVRRKQRWILQQLPLVRAMQPAGAVKPAPPFAAR